jgi:hypothetical protein
VAGIQREGNLLGATESMLSLVVPIIGLALAIAAFAVTLIIYRRSFLGSQIEVADPKSSRERISDLDAIVDGDAVHPMQVALMINEAAAEFNSKADGQPLSEKARDGLFATIKSLEEQRINLIRQVRKLEADFAADDRRYALLRAYAQQGLNQTRFSFLASLAAAGLGFIVIITGVMLAIVQADPTGGITTVAAGTVIDAVSLLFFSQDRRHQRTMLEFFERLREDRKLDEALLLMRTAQHGELQARVHAAITLHFANVPDALQILDSPGPRLKFGDASTYNVRQVLYGDAAPRRLVGGRFRLPMNVKAAIEEIVEALPEGRLDGWDYRDHELEIQLSQQNLTASEERVIRDVAARHSVDLHRIYSGDP